MKHLFIIFQLFLASVAFSQYDPIRFEQITAKEGLSQGHVLSMIQDSEGYIWIGTYYGLNRYNGYSFDIFHHEKDDTNSPVINVAFSLFEDKDGYVWVGTWGVSIFDKKTEKFTNIPAGEGSISAGEVSAICQDASGNMWLATQGGGINRIEYKTRKITYIRAGEAPNSLRSDFINDLLIDNSQNLWIATENGGLSRMDPVNGTLFTFPDNVLPSDKISCLFKDRDECIWLGDSEGNLLKYDPAENSFIVHDYTRGLVNFKKEKIMKIAMDWKGDLLIATNGSGFIIYDVKHQSSHLYTHDSNNSETIISNEISSILVDKTNTVFLGSYGRGISKYSHYSGKFEVHKVKEGHENNNVNNLFTDGIEDNSGNLIAGTYNGFFVFDKNWNYKHILPGNTYEDNKVLTLTLAPDSTVWIGTMRHVFRYDKNFNKLNAYLFDETLKDHSVYTITFDDHDNLWIGLFRKGTIKIKGSEWRNKRKKNPEFILYRRDYDDSSTVCGNQPWTIYMDHKKDIWIGTEGGLSRYDFENNQFTTFFSEAAVKTVQTDSKGKLWMGTIGEGLYSLEPEKGNIKRFTVNDGLSHSFIYGLIVDKSDNIWIGTEYGLTRYSEKSDSFKVYDTRDGLPDNHFDDRSESLLGDGRIYMGTNNGFILFKPDDIKDDTSQTRVVLTGLKINNDPVFYFKDESGDTSLILPVGHLRKIRLLPSQRDITFEFAALHYAAPHKIQYKYMLEGYDKEWISASAANRIARYTNLDGGEFTFMVRSTNSDGNWTGRPLTLKLTVIPPFYKSVWFNLLLIAIGIILISVFYGLRIRRQIRQTRKLSRLVDERTKEISRKNILLEKTAEDLQQLNYLLVERQQQIEEQTEELAAQRDELALSNATKDKLFTIVAHDLKNPFNVILGYIELLIINYHKWEEERKLYFLTLVKESSGKVYNLLDNLLQWARSQSGTLTCKPEIIAVEKIIEIAKAGVSTFAENKNVRLSFSAQPELMFFADEHMLVAILRNIITNAVKFSLKGEKVEVTFEKFEHKNIQITVKDYGIGMNEIQLQNLFRLDRTKINPGTEGESGTGLGLIICKEFIEIQKGRIWAESVPGQGTSFYIVLPSATSV